MSEAFAVDGVDHVELFVSDRESARDWYERVLGLTADETFAAWWESGEGPLVLSAGPETTKLALFERETATRDDAVSPHRVAFRTSADGFLSFLDRLETLALSNRAGEPATREAVVDHGLSFSIYFTDPDGNRLELTTNDHEAAAVELGS